MSFLIHYMKTTHLKTKPSHLELHLVASSRITFPRFKVYLFFYNIKQQCPLNPFGFFDSFSDKND